MKEEIKPSKPVKIKQGYLPQNFKDRWVWNFVLREFPKLKINTHEDNFIEFDLGKKRFKIVRLK